MGSLGSSQELGGGRGRGAWKDQRRRGNCAGYLDNGSEMGGSKESEGQRRWSGESAQTLQSEVSGHRAQEAGLCAVGREEAQGARSPRNRAFWRTGAGFGAASGLGPGEVGEEGLTPNV